MSNQSVPPAPGKRRILVAGDVCLDVVAVPIPEKAASPTAENWRQTGETRTHFLLGGAMLLAEFIRAPRLRLTPGQAARRAVEDDIAGPRPERPAGIAEGTGGALYTADFINIAERLRRKEIVHSLLALASFPSTTNKDDKTRTLRVDRVHGYSGPETDDPSLVISYPLQESPEILVLDDTGNRFRKDDRRNPWPQDVREAVTAKAAPFLVYKLHRPLPVAASQPGQSPVNPLWAAAAARFEFNRVVVISVDDLREFGLPISLGLSWERTALDVVWHLLNVPALAELRNCPRLIIRLGESGAVYWQHRVASKEKDGHRAPESCRAWLIYDPGEIEGSFTARFDHRGSMVGLGSVFTAALVQHLANTTDAEFQKLLDSPTFEYGRPNDPEPPVLAGIRAGLVATRRLLQTGFGPNLEQPRYPGAELFDPPAEAEAGFACRPIPIIPDALQPDRGYWRLLDDIFTDATSELRMAVQLTATGSRPGKTLPMDASLTEVSAAAPDQQAAYLLAQAPIAVFAKALRTWDRREIENYRALYALMHDYIRLREPERPLSVAVFGPPGAGKSFGVKQVAIALTEHNQRRPIVDLTFNLSQYRSADELAAAFHLVRDLVLQGKIPLVFFDEFDTALNDRKLAWLRYFLAPMQDGLFLDRGTLHPIGQAIFVFAGGTCDTHHEFTAHVSMSDAEFKAAKGPDFLSRLRGALDIPSLNFSAPRGSRPTTQPDLRERVTALPAEVRGPYASPWPALANIALAVMEREAAPSEHSDAAQVGRFDPYGPIECFPCEAATLLRRAWVLAYQLGTKGPALKDAEGSVRIRPEVLRTFLYLPRFEHGNRSLEAMLDMSHLPGAHTYTPALLPPPVHALLHANPAHLNQLVATEYPFPEPELDVIARRIHAAYLAERDRAGKFDANKASHKPWESLSDFYKNRNRESARETPNKLRSVGLWFRKAVGTPSGRYPVPDAELDALVERLAADEHDRWVADQRRQGYVSGPNEDHTRRHHPCIEPWVKLSEATKNQDRDTVRNIPAILAAAGYEVVKM